MHDKVSYMDTNNEKELITIKSLHLCKKLKWLFRIFLIAYVEEKLYIHQMNIIMVCYLYKKISKQFYIK